MNWFRLSADIYSKCTDHNKYMRILYVSIFPLLSIILITETVFFARGYLIAHEYPFGLKMPLIGWFAYAFWYIIKLSKINFFPKLTKFPCTGFFLIFQKKKRINIKIVSFTFKRGMIRHPLAVLNWQFDKKINLHNLVVDILPQKST